MSVDSKIGKPNPSQFDTYLTLTSPHITSPCCRYPSSLAVLTSPSFLTVLQRHRNVTHLHVPSSPRGLGLSRPSSVIPSPSRRRASPGKPIDAAFRAYSKDQILSILEERLNGLVAKIHRQSFNWRMKELEANIISRLNRVSASFLLTPDYSVSSLSCGSVNYCLSSSLIENTLYELHISFTSLRN
ncbi:hypothetical protein PIB30_009353 [Stylosanthes scabra]|uniref:Uncharacterized protein n=1 Tax=Stylosanthes scabra TaxID=79078 RepID=A0ABU6U3Y8_9FABA|nr:hypothetical protein [Stylosanthes scabra]